MSNCGNCGNVLKPGGGCGCLNCPPGEPGQDGANGLSAYEIWLGEGNVGTEQDFLDSLVGPPGEDGQDGTNGVPSPKISFYQQEISTIEVSSDPFPTIYHFPVGYGNLTYTNNTGQTRNYVVHVSYECEIRPDNIPGIYHVVDSAIIKTVSAVDTIEYERFGNHIIGGSLYWGPNLIDIITSNPASVNVVADNDGLAEFRFGTVNVPINVAYFKTITLQNGESVSLKFKTIEPGVASTLLQAQIFVLELD